MFRKFIKPAIAAAAITASVMMPSASFAENKTLNFGIISTESSQNLRTIWNPFLEDMGK